MIMEGDHVDRLGRLRQARKVQIYLHFGFLPQYPRPNLKEKIVSLLLYLSYRIGVFFFGFNILRQKYHLLETKCRIVPDLFNQGDGWSRGPKSEFKGTCIRSIFYLQASIVLGSIRLAYGHWTPLPTLDATLAAADRIKKKSKK